MIRIYLLLLVSVSVSIASCGGDDDDDATTYTGDPEGRIVFTSGDEGAEDVYIMGADGADAVNLTNSADVFDREADVSPDGERIAFISLRSGVVDLWQMGIDGSDPVQITNDPAVDAAPIWSPDGSQLAFWSGRAQEKGSLWVLDIETGGTGPLLDLIEDGPETACRGGTPTDWPENDVLVYSGTQANISASQVCSVNPVDFTIATLVSQDSVAIFDAELSPDGTMIAYSSDETGNFEIWVAQADGTEPVRLTFDPGRDSWPTWSPDGQWLAFASERDGDFEIYIMRPDGTDLQKLTDNDTEDTLPDWVS